MAKKSKKKEDETKKVVAKCDNPNEVVANCNNLEEVITNCDNPQETSLSQYDIEKLIVTVRGEQVLIDQDIARIYGVTTKRLNEQAKRVHNGTDPIVHLYPFRANYLEKYRATVFKG